MAAAPTATADAPRLESRTRPLERWEWAPLAALTLLAAALRFATLDLQSFDFDEAFTVGRVLGGSLPDVFDGLPKTESTPPLYYVLAWGWTRPFGLGEVGIRSFSALLGTALVPIAFAAARELVGSRVGLVAAALVAVNPLLVFYSQEARAYALFALLATLSFWAFLVARRSPTNRNLALWALASALALLTHYFAVFLIVPEALALLAEVRPLRRAVAAVAAVGGVGIALIPLALDQADARTAWISDLSVADRVKEVAKKPLTSEFDPTTNWQLAGLALVVLAGIGYGLARGSARERRGFLIAMGLAAALLLLPLALDLVGKDYLIAKNVLPAVVLAAIAVAAALGARGAGRVGLALTLAACVFFIGVVVVQATDHRYQRPDYRAIADELGRPPPDAAVLVPYHGSAPLERYSGAQQGTSATVGELEVALPLQRGDLPGPARPPTPPPPEGFRLAGRLERPSFSLIRYLADQPQPVTSAGLYGLAPGTTRFPPVLLTWPG